MAITLVTHAAAQAPTINSDAVTSGVDTSTVTLLVAVVALTSSIHAPTDSNSNSWVQIDTQSIGTFGAVYYVKNPVVGAAHTFTLVGGTNQGAALAVLAFAGTNTAANVDQHTTAGNQDGTSPITAGSVTPSEDNEVIVTMLDGNMGETIAVDSGVTLVDHLPFIGGQAYAVSSGYHVQTTAAAINPSWSYTPGSIEHAYNATFKASTAQKFILIPGR